MKMKMNISIDLQDIFDEQNEHAYQEGSEDRCGGSGYNLSDVIKGEITGAILNKVSKQCIDAVMKKANEKIDLALQNAIDKAVLGIEQKAVDYAENWLDGDNVILTDKWGKETEVTNIRSIVENAYSDTLNKKVDDSGKFSASSYGNNTTLANYITSKHVKECVEKRLPDMSRKLDKMIQKAIDDHSSELITNKIAKVLASA
tara:strand:+ start:63 stop:668 length:606 start_codon:yes stop_codon:yes gene_type:complete